MHEMTSFINTWKRHVESAFFFPAGTHDAPNEVFSVCVRCVDCISVDDGYDLSYEVPCCWFYCEALQSSTHQS